MEFNISNKITEITPESNTNQSTPLLGGTSFEKRAEEVALAANENTMVLRFGMGLNMKKISAKAKAYLEKNPLQVVGQDGSGDKRFSWDVKATSIDITIPEDQKLRIGLKLNGAVRGLIKKYDIDNTVSIQVDMDLLKVKTVNIKEKAYYLIFVDLSKVEEFSVDSTILNAILKVLGLIFKLVLTKTFYIYSFSLTTNYGGAKLKVPKGKEISLFTWKDNGVLGIAWAANYGYPFLGSVCKYQFGDKCRDAGAIAVAYVDSSYLCQQVFELAKQIPTEPKHWFHSGMEMKLIDEWGQNAHFILSMLQGHKIVVESDDGDPLTIDHLDVAIGYENNHPVVLAHTIGSTKVLKSPIGFNVVSTTSILFGTVHEGKQNVYVDTKLDSTKVNIGGWMGLLYNLIFSPIGQILIGEFVMPVIASKIVHSKVDKNQVFNDLAIPFADIAHITKVDHQKGMRDNSSLTIFLEE